MEKSRSSVSSAHGKLTYILYKWLFFVINYIININVERACVTVDLILNECDEEFLTGKVNFVN